jgi:pimeloyl-ACP methyl ester carboxylesterase
MVTLTVTTWSLSITCPLLGSRNLWCSPMGGLLYGRDEASRGSMSGLIIFLHGMRGDETTWDTVPAIVEAALKSFEVVCMTYSGEMQSYADCTKSADQILTRIKREHQKNDPIFLVGYSMGGIVAREVCLRLLERPEDKPWLEKIRATISVGSPLCGLQTTAGVLANLASKYLSPKISQVGDLKNNNEFIFGRYKRGITAAKARGTNGPKHSHIEIENDGYVAKHEITSYSDDDAHAGVVHGTHREFLQTVEQKKRLANLIVQLIREQHSSSERSWQISPPTATDDLPARLLLIACSNRKRPGGEREYQGPGPARWIANAELRERVLSRRALVLSMLKGAKIDNGFEKAENRLHQAPNRVLKRGPDFGGVDESDNQATYMPAYLRYDGKCYTQIKPTSWDRYFESNQNKMSVLIMSGLYGLIEAAEWIQEYDIHLTDRVMGAGIPLSSMWVDLFTDSLSDYIQRAYRGKKVQIINCLCDDYYNDSIQWRKLPNCSVYHLASTDYSHKDLLPPAGTVVDYFLQDPERIEVIERTTREKARLYQLSDFGRPPPLHEATRIAFEARLGDLKELGQIKSRDANAAE